MRVAGTSGRSCLLQLEWMSNDIGKAFDLQRSNPFELRNVHIMHSLEELDELGNDPKVLRYFCAASCQAFQRIFTQGMPCDWGIPTKRCAFDEIAIA